MPNINQSRLVPRTLHIPRRLWIKSLTILLLSTLLMYNRQVPQTDAVVQQRGLQQGQAEGSRTVDFYWHSFFNATMISDVWLARQSFYGDTVLSWRYPVVYIWPTLEGPTLPDGNPNPHPEGSLWYYAPARLKVTGRYLPEISMSRPEFVPYNLLGGLSPTVTSGYANISYYMQYITIARAQQLKIYTPGSYDGYISELQGPVRMDRNATMRILGLTPTEYEALKVDPTGWWNTNENTVEAEWSEFLINEANTRLQVQPMLEYSYTVFSSSKFPGVDLTLTYDAANDQVTLDTDVVAWGNEVLLARWFRETFLKGYEYWYSDLRLNVRIAPSYSHVDLDTTVDWALYQWSVASEKYAQGVWAFEPVLGDEVPSIKISGKTYYSKEFPLYVFSNGTYKTYYNVAPGNAWYDQYQPYDYIPSAWNLQTGETLRINYSLPGPVWVLTQRPDGSVTNSSGVLAVSYTEPYLSSLGEKISLDKTNRILTFTGPINAEEWLRVYFSSEWARLADTNYPNGVLPWGVPYVEFFQESVAIRDVAVTGTTVFPSTTTLGTTVTITAIAVNLGDLAEVFDVAVYSNSTLLYEVGNITLMRHQASTIDCSWNTTGASPGNYVIKVATGSISGESITWNNVDYASVTLSLTTPSPPPPPAVHDVNVLNVVPSATSVSSGDPLTVTVFVKNEGNANESFDLTAFVDLMEVGTSYMTSVAAGETRTVEFVWNTTNVAPGDYTVSATASQLDNETDTADNAFIYGKVTVNKMTSSITISVTPSVIDLGNNTNVSGHLSPTKEGIAVQIYVRTSQGNWNHTSSTVTNNSGKYSYTWTPTEVGTYEIKANWTGDTYTQVSESNTYVVIVRQTAVSPSQNLGSATNDLNILHLTIGIGVGVTSTLLFFIIKRRRSLPKVKPKTTAKKRSTAT